MGFRMGIGAMHWGGGHSIRTAMTLQLGAMKESWEHFTIAISDA
jgi:hypothetical protein